MFNFRKNNHYVSQFYLRQWESSEDKTFQYSIVVPHENHPLWVEKSISGTAYHEHLYTQTKDGVDSDTFEKWIGDEIESPAKISVGKALKQQRLTSTDWHHLVRFLALQDVRTPSRLGMMLSHWKKEMPTFLNKTLQDIISSIQSSRLDIPLTETINVTGFHSILDVRVKPDPKKGNSTIETQAVVNRDFWVNSAQHILTNTYHALLSHRWTILHSPNGFSWCTSDHPVVCMKDKKFAGYDTNIGWGTPDAEIFMPLSPHHLLYTRVGIRPPSKGFVLQEHNARRFQEAITRRAHRAIFSATRNNVVPKLRPRTVDLEVFQREKELWQKFHENHRQAIIELGSQHS